MDGTIPLDDRRGGAGDRARLNNIGSEHNAPA